MSSGAVSSGAVSGVVTTRLRGQVRAAASTATVALALLLGACTSARSNLGTSDSSCYRALPVATAAVHSHGRLLGIHLFTEAKLRSLAPHLSAELIANGMVMHASTTVCAAAFTGAFVRTRVEKPIDARSSGKLAVVVVREPQNSLVGTAIFRRAPLHFTHTHLG